MSVNMKNPTPQKNCDAIKAIWAELELLKSKKSRSGNQQGETEIQQRDMQKQMDQMQETIRSLQQKLEIQEQKIREFLNESQDNNAESSNNNNNNDNDLAQLDDDDLEQPNNNDAEQRRPDMIRSHASRNLFTRRLLRSTVSFDHEEDEVEQTLPPDTYTFLMCAKVCSIPFFLGVAVFLLQMYIGWLLQGGFNNLISSKGDRFNRNIDNDNYVLIAQVITIFLAVIMQGDIRTSMLQLGEGYRKSQIDDLFEDATCCKWLLANICRLLVGFWSLIITMYLILHTNEVFNILLKVTAVGFVCALDDFFFYLGSLGVMGKSILNKATEVESKKYAKFARSKKCILCFQVVSALLLIFIFF